MDASEIKEMKRRKSILQAELFDLKKFIESVNQEKDKLRDRLCEYRSRQHFCDYEEEIEEAEYQIRQIERKLAELQNEQISLQRQIEYLPLS